MTKEITICKNCKHHLIRDEGTGLNIWYNWVCTHKKLERRLSIDHITGKECYFIAIRETDKLTPTAEKHPLCKDINKGHCDLYEKNLM